eukprot:5933010-Amphidinium_carterae.2
MHANYSKGVRLLGYKCLGAIEGEPMKYVHADGDRPKFRTMVSRRQNPHKHMAKHLEKFQRSNALRVDAKIIGLLSAVCHEFVTSLGSRAGVIMMYSSWSCNTAPMRMCGWVYGKRR